MDTEDHIEFKPTEGEIKILVVRATFEIFV